MKNSKLLLYVSVLLSILFYIQSAPLYAAAMQDYCIIPPYVKRDVSVNIMVQFDNSQDMLEPAFPESYCPTQPADSNCWNSGAAPASYYKTYYGTFAQKVCYKTGGGAGGNFTANAAPVYVDFATYPDTGCPANYFNGNVLNWATMSKMAIVKHVMTGEASNAPLKAFEIQGRKTIDGTDWWPQRAYDGCAWDYFNDSIDTLYLRVCNKDVAGSCKFPVTIAGNTCINETHTNNLWEVSISPTTGVETRRGVLQDFTDINPIDESFDSGAPRFGLTRFTRGGGGNVSIDINIPPTGTYRSFINAFNPSLNVGTLNDLATAHYTIDADFQNPANVNSDPYLGCANYESSYCTQGVPVPCRKSAILMLTSGADVGGTPFPSGTACVNPDGTCLIGNARYVNNNDLRSDLDGNQTIQTYVVHAFGTTNVDTLKRTASDGGGTYYSADSNNLEQQLRQALSDIIKRAAAGTAASVLASGEGQGANLIQAVFYPRKKFYNPATLSSDEIAWVGRLTNFWYYVDPFFTCSNIREDTVKESPYSKLNLIDDYIIQLYFDTSTETTKARRWQDTDGDGCANGSKLATDIELEKLGNLWEAGLELWKRPVKPWDPSDTANNRTIKTTTGSGFTDFSINNKTTLKDYLQAGSDAEAESIIRYIHGEDTQTGGNFANSPVAGFNPDYRPRTVAIDLNGDGILDSGEEAKVWKLGDILNSTPRIASWIQLNNYDSRYSDKTYKNYINDLNDDGTPKVTPNYTSRGMVFAGANDGMLHAFKLGSLNLPDHNEASPTCTFGSKDIACLSGTELGKEVWAFIPKNALPYLKYLTDPGYCHVYTVDLTPYIFDASINGLPTDTRTVNSWRTILIGGMRFGGACKKTCATTDCVQTPATDPLDSTKGLGYSSYFALDITDQNNPTLLWEFSNESLGFATTAPAVVRIGDKDKNGSWFVVLGSGPTGPTTGSSTTEYQFLGGSNQPLKIFVTGPLSTTPGLPPVTPIDPSPSIPDAFAGSMLNSPHDSDLDYQDDVLYIPYVKKDTTAGTWTQGGVGRLLTKKDPTPSNWAWSKVIDDIGPVTSSVVRLQKKDKGILWIFFGTGRYYFERTAEIDDPGSATDLRKLFGVKEPCFSSSGFAATCPSPLGIGDLTNVTDIAAANAITNPDSPSFNGWYINLDGPGTVTYCDVYNADGTCAQSSTKKYRAERVITDPLSTTSGLVFFTTYKPFDDICALGGKSFVWAVKYSTGGAAGALLKGKALVQVSTGSIEQLNLSTAFTEAGGRKSSALEGVPPTAQGLSLLSTPPPVKRILHMRER